MNTDYRSIKLAVRRDDGFVDVSPDQFGDNGSGVPFEGILPHGVFGQPRDEDKGAANVLLFRHGDEGFAMPTNDPRFVALLPNTGGGGAGLASETDTDGTLRTPHICLFGKGGAQPEGTLRIEIPSSAGTTTLVIDPTSGDLTITHATGAVVIVNASGVELGAAGGIPVALATPLIAWAATVETRLGTLGQSGTAPAGVAATKAKAT